MKNNKKKYKYKIAIIPGDGIGKEVTHAAIIILENIIKDLDIKIDKKIFYWGSNYYRKHGVMMPKNGLEKLSNYDAILFGAVGDPKIPDDITLWGLRLEICQNLDQFANIRPSKYYPGIKSPLNEDIAKTNLESPTGLDNLLYTADADFSCFADLALTSPADYYKEGLGSLLQCVLTPGDPWIPKSVEEIVKHTDGQVRKLFPTAKNLNL